MWLLVNCSCGSGKSWSGDKRELRDVQVFAGDSFFLRMINSNGRGTRGMLWKNRKNRQDKTKRIMNDC